MTVRPAGYAEATVAAYELYAAKAIASWERLRVPSRWLTAFAALLPAGGRVLDYGCGIGTEMRWLLARGFRVDGVDGSRAFVREARRRCPGERVVQGLFDAVPLAAGAYDGVWCQAALMHVPPERLPEQLEKLRRALRPQGWLGLTLAWGRRRGVLDQDWIPGRYWAGYSKRDVQAMLGNWRVRELRVMQNDGRVGRWVKVLAAADAAAG